MDVENSNRSDVRCRRPLKRLPYIVNNNIFSMETYFVWFSALIFLTELVTDLCLVAYYIHENEVRWGLITFAIIFLPLMICQLCSLLMMRTQKAVETPVLVVHLFLMGIPYRYHSILRKVDKDKMTTQEVEYVRNMIREVNVLQTVNAILQYCPQFMFQAFLIVYKKYKCIITGVSAGLAGFSFLWHIFIHFYYYAKSCHTDLDASGSVAENGIIDNLTSSQRRNVRNLTPTEENLSKNYKKCKISDNLKIFEKPMYKTDDNNLMSKKPTLKHVEKNKLFGFNKRKTVYQTNDFDVSDINNTSTVFFEVNESSDSYNKLCISPVKRAEEFNNENNANLSITKKMLDKESDPEFKSTDMAAGPVESRFLKRKGICSSQEMLHLVDIMSDIPPEQIDVMAKSLVEMGGEENLKTDTEQADNSRLLEKFPEMIDAKLMENIETVIYENQVIFQERIRKNQLTIQNLKLQDQLLSKYIDSIKNLPSNEVFSIRDYENMCFANVSRQNRLKHWRNYLQDINTHMHDNSTVQNSSFYVNTNTMSNSLTDLYVNGTDVGSVATDDCKLSDQVSTPSSLAKKIPRAIKLPPSDELSLDDNMSDHNFYVNMSGSSSSMPRKNILVETINAINADTPVRNLLSKSSNLPNSIASSIK
ncbi:unnamed protein product [Hermetia illucens]|uniref:XK-related protein n=2 Tax=Hermetia illucens TaxID=343691 RepID=A0A7R8UHG7_HERIL|nr:unnamed protein product [Hermetia illucens]